ncbi:family 16 glycosylhydrolase [Streptomyces sp. NPDC057257]|uniref:family 16 glycosylhydrolase n=1 Tax=Streptomyces sp. NPDC057257 TaxID=3346071 RepID=UPI0036283B38
MRKPRLKTLLIGLATAVSLVAVLPGPAHAADTPANPLARSGYTLDFDEEFDGTSLDTSKWLPEYLPHWTPYTDRAQAQYTVSGGYLNEYLASGTQPWNPSYDGNVKVSSIQTYEKDWWHRFNSSMPLDHSEPDFNGYTTKYGYFEMRAKLSDAGGGGHQAMWLVGTGDTSSASQNPEIDMLETWFSKPNNWRIENYGWGDPNFVSSWTGSDTALPSGSGSPTSEYHIYAMDWTPTALNFYYDGTLYYTVNDAPNMAMGMFLSIYTDASSGAANSVWPKSWSVDYLRVYKKNGGYPVSYVRLRNRNTGQYMYSSDSSGKVQSGNVAASDTSSQWAEETTGDGCVRFKNRATGQYMHIEDLNGNVEVGAVPATYWSSQWTEESVNGGYVRLKNRWKTANYMHTENNTGYVQYGAVPSTYWSSQWSLQPVS